VIDMTCTGCAVWHICRRLSPE